jgi:hypothetical protein
MPDECSRTHLHSIFWYLEMAPASTSSVVSAARGSLRPTSVGPSRARSEPAARDRCARASNNNAHLRTFSRQEIRNQPAKSRALSPGEESSVSPGLQRQALFRSAAIQHSPPAGLVTAGITTSLLKHKSSTLAGRNLSERFGSPSPSQKQWQSAPLGVYSQSVPSLGRQSSEGSTSRRLSTRVHYSWDKDPPEERLPFYPPSSNWGPSASPFVLLFTIVFFDALILWAVPESAFLTLLFSGSLVWPLWGMLELDSQNGHFQPRDPGLPPDWHNLYR